MGSVRQEHCSILENHKNQIEESSSIPKNQKSQIEESETQNKLDFILSNVQGLITGVKNKVNYFYENFGKQQILALTETWFHEGIVDAEILSIFKDFTLIRSDRNTKSIIDGKSKRGGCALLIPNHITAKHQLSFSNGICELLIVHLVTLNTIIAVIYRPPDSSLQKFSEVMDLTKRHFENHENEFKIICGDFNFPTEIVQWYGIGDRIYDRVIEGRNFGELHDKREAFKMLKGIVSENFMQQLVNKPTREERILDLVYSNNTDILTDVSTEEMIGISDHRAVKFRTNWNDVKKSEKKNTKPKIANFDLSKAKWTDIKEEMEAINWTNELKNKSSAQMKEKIISIITNIFEGCQTPLKKYGENATGSIPWKRRQLFRKKVKLNKKILQCNNNEYKNTLLEKVHEINKKLQDHYEQEQQRKEKTVIENIKRSSKAFFKYANSKKKNKSSIGPLWDGEALTSDNKKMAELLSNQYESVFSKPNDEKKISNAEDFFQNIHSDGWLTNINITEEELIKTLKALPSNSSPGPDGVSTDILKNLAEQMAVPLRLLFQNSIDKGEPLESPYKANVTPIHKGGDRASPQKYRPVCLTSHIVKTLERILRKEIVNHLEKNMLMNVNQHGFRAKHSTMTQLVGYYDKIINDMEKGSSMDAIYIDFAKAFDTVDHGILLHKLKEKTKITGNIGKWIHSFLTDRIQQVTVNGEPSEEVKVTSGVPQGTVLGPVLFLIMISDIDENVQKSFVSMYADDTRVIKKIREEDDENDLKNDLKSIYKWAEDNNMKFNADKFELIRFSIKNNDENHSYLSPDGKLIEYKQDLKDLGIYLSSNLKFDTHIDIVTTKAMEMTGWILRTFKTRDRYPLMIVFKQLILGKIEYCCPVWSPIDNQNIKKN